MPDSRWRSDKEDDLPRGVVFQLMIKRRNVAFFLFVECCVLSNVIKLQNSDKKIECAECRDNIFCIFVWIYAYYSK